MEVLFINLSLEVLLVMKIANPARPAYAGNKTPSPCPGCLLELY